MCVSAWKRSGGLKQLKINLLEAVDALIEAAVNWASVSSYFYFLFFKNIFRENKKREYRRDKGFKETAEGPQVDLEVEWYSSYVT